MSITYRKVQKEYDEVVSVTCSKCRKIIMPDDHIEWQEYQTISFVSGYGSKFGDGVSIRIDLCQSCLFDLVSDFYEIEEWEDMEDI